MATNCTYNAAREHTNSRILRFLGSKDIREVEGVVKGGRVGGVFARNNKKLYDTKTTTD